MDIKVFDVKGKAVGQIALDKAWEGPVNTGLLNQALAMYRTNIRAGTAHTKTRAFVSGGGKKPFKQKHTGRARAGSTRSPLWRHGGSIFGPRTRDFGFRLPQTIRRKALVESLKGKVRDDELVVLDALTANKPQTKPFAGLAKTFQARRGSVIVLDEQVDAVIKSLRNLDAFELRFASNLNAFDILNAHKVLVTKAAFERLQNRTKDKDSDASSN